MAQIQMQRIEAGAGQGFREQGDHFQIRFQSGLSEQFDADLNGGARFEWAARARVENLARIAQARRIFAAQAVGIHARHLGRDVGAHAHHATAQLVGNLERDQIQVRSGAAEQ